MCIWEYLKYVGTYVIFLDIKSYALTTFVLYQTGSVVKILHLNWPTSQWLTKKPFSFSWVYRLAEVTISDYDTGFDPEF